ncbi:GNAT family N-acetyltransferase [Tropicimonas sp. S265A]|uniref:GNAT family N-acetyltransferase n=1 Tax=Tropicimonas sp. S265A TaxID=3415134 RepID=UPI003C7AB9A3
MVSYSIRQATARDHLAISILLNTNFEGPSEGRLVQDLRSQGVLTLEAVAVDGDALVGHIAFSNLEAPEGWAALSPVSVRWDRRETGIGSALVQYGLDQLRQQHVPGIVVLGDPQFYRRFGFSLAAARNLKTPYPADNFMLFPIGPDVSGSTHEVIYPRAFRYL